MHAGTAKIDEIGKVLVNYANVVFITRGEDGISVFQKDGESFNVEALEVDDVKSVRKAGLIACALDLTLTTGTGDRRWRLL